MESPNRKLIYTCSIPIRWRDVDPFDVVNHSVYFTYMEEARWKWFYSLNLQEKLDWVLLVVEANIRYKKALKHPGTAVIKLYVEPITGKSWSIFHEISLENDPHTIYAEATLKFVCYDSANKKVVAVPAELQKHL